MAESTGSKITPFWATMIVILIGLGLLVLFSDFFTTRQQPEQEPQPPSTEWTTAPEGGVEVDLPATPLETAQPTADATEQSGAGEAE